MRLGRIAETNQEVNPASLSGRLPQDFLTVCCPEIGANAKTLGVLPNTTIQQLEEQCATRFEQSKLTRG